MTEPWFSADDIAAPLDITKDPIYTWIAEKNMPAHRISRPLGNAKRPGLTAGLATVVRRPRNLIP